MSAKHTMYYPDIIIVHGVLWFIAAHRIANELVYKNRVNIFNTICFLVDFLIHIDRISMGLAIVYFKGSQVEFSKL